MSLRKSAAALVLTTDDVRQRSDGWHRHDDLVRWGSISKVLTAGLAHVAVAEERLGWDTTVDEILGGGCDATVADLVNHRSGLPRVLPAQQRQIVDPYRLWDRDRFDEQAVPALAALVDRDRRTVGEYSNLGYAVLTRMVEEGSAPWIEQVRRDLAEPAELEPSSVDVARATGDRRDVVEARSIWGRPLDEWAIGDGPFVGAGGLVSTLSDMAHLVRHAAREGGWLDPTLHPHAWEVEEGVATHTGSLMRSGAVLVLRPDTGTVAVASAVGGTPAFGDRAAMTFLESFVNELEETPA